MGWPGKRKGGGRAVAGEARRPEATKRPRLYRPVTRQWWPHPVFVLSLPTTISLPTTPFSSTKNVLQGPHLACIAKALYWRTKLLKQFRPSIQCFSWQLVQQVDSCPQKSYGLTLPCRTVEEPRSFPDRFDPLFPAKCRVFRGVEGNLFWIWNLNLAVQTCKKCCGPGWWAGIYNTSQSL